MDAHPTRPGPGHPAPPDPARPDLAPPASGRPDSGHSDSGHSDADLFTRHGLDAERLLTTLGDLPPSTIAGLEPTEESLLIHLEPIRDDPRGTLAGLFEVVAPRSWQAVAVCVEGRSDAVPGEDPDDETEVDIRALLMRSGVLCTRIDGADGSEQLPATTSHPSSATGSAPDAPSGLLVDCLHRMLGLATPGPAPDAVDVALGTWAQAMLEHLFDRGDLSWVDAVRLHPGAPGAAGAAAASLEPVAPSVETLVEATFRSTDDWDWARVHRRARHGSVRAALTPGEAAWMDTAMYGRWVVSHLADPLGVAELLDSHDFDQVAAGLRAVVDGVERWRDPAGAA